MSRRLRVVAGAVIRDGRVLATRRGPDQSQAGLWELPGGKVEPGEADDAALARELDEELGLEVVVEPTAFGVSVHDYGTVVVELVAHRCRWRGGALELREHDASAWLAADALDTVVWAPADVPLLEPLAALLRG